MVVKSKKSKKVVKKRKIIVREIKSKIKNNKKATDVNGLFLEKYDLVSFIRQSILQNFIVLDIKFDWDTWFVKIRHALVTGDSPQWVPADTIRKIGRAKLKN